MIAGSHTNLLIKDEIFDKLRIINSPSKLLHDLDVAKIEEARASRIHDGENNIDDKR
ncbi:hypothetical protein ACLOJK_037133, partial [Asimina triloba]